ncbi:hypothetical protein DP145_08715 [Clostridium tetani]|uniref:hypothetical protein n=1 Tax=Clostridium tetani TaxID=1513 RepID=UPI00100B4FB0|nr:hypothetical protein [Clostridium tetani]RXI46498.1 hypothetical protein DP126_06195 [Clostridium tetani]RXM61577.1 hypothetical protein DP138_01850 [Clostridium tetani]RXM66274.1 hypothetical protein DP145_08715 [Clostridium tetani]
MNKKSVIAFILMLSCIISLIKPQVVLAQGVSVDFEQSLHQELDRLGYREGMNPSSDEMLVFLRNLGFTDKELIDLYQSDANRFNSKIMLPSGLRQDNRKDYVEPNKKNNNNLLFGFPSNPREGQKHIESYNINFANLASDLGYAGGGIAGACTFIAKLTPSAVLKAVIKSVGVIVGSALGVAAWISHLRSNVHTGVRGKSEFVYGRTNDLYLDWIYIQGTRTRIYY